jgi:superfamily I DNA/RNA helicase
MGIVRRISKRRHKEWSPRTEKGALSYYHSMKDLDMASGDWMVLARTKHMLNDVEKILQARGLYYKNKFKDNPEKDLYKAIIDWEDLRNKKFLKTDQIVRIASYMSPENYKKEQLQYLDKDSMYHMDELSKKGLSTQRVWYEAFDNAPTKAVRYVRRMRENGEKLNQDPRILLSTIHGVKGGECDNVALLTDLSYNTQKNFERNPDDENRLFYVGATRTKNHLHVIRPKDPNKKGYKI